MEVSYILDGLNDFQRQAVAAPSGSYLILAGAGSGKTRVLVNRIAWLIQTQNISPYSILAVTFTNKAAAEMRTRIESMLAMPVRGMWIGTFHGIANRLLRSHWQEAKLPQNFQILDADDQLRLIKRVIISLELDEKKWPARAAMYFINSHKDQGLRPGNIEDYGDIYIKTNLDIYKSYEQACQRGGMVDFGEMLLRAHELWLNNSTLLKHYQNRFSNLLVDEFQDTNTIQYAWIRLLAGANDNIMVVGDDDQSIYGWRGAKIENIQLFGSDFSNSETIRLEQNYRSSGNILQAANELIAHNPGRLGKQLWTDSDDGEPIKLYAGYNEIDESRYIVSCIKEWSDQGNPFKEAAILYRSNAQSRVLEEALLRLKIPYRIYGGQRFFERAEIRTVLAYMRLISNRGSDAAFERIVNTPTRGIGDKTVQNIRQLARHRDVSMWQASISLVDSTQLTNRSRNAIDVFIQLINSLDELTKNCDLSELCEIVIAQTGLQSYYEKEKGERGQARLENLKELVTATKTFDPEQIVSFDPLNDGTNGSETAETQTLLDDFLSHAALEAGEGQGDLSQDCVQMMTLHSAKGLEFPLVFLSGLEDGLFPHQMSMQEPGRLEEERRLCYVGITRAMKKLVLTYAESRRINGSETFNRVSRFIEEIPRELIEEVRLRGNVIQPPSGLKPFKKNILAGNIEGTGLTLGQTVMHNKFGEGVVVNYEGEGKQARIQVNFKGEGSKWLMLAYANLQPL
ncbi:MAG: DNA helicase II [Pseudomonadales bacterium]|nr:DNA helicase II [Pseudomonadales bacterium]